MPGREAHRHTPLFLDLNGISCLLVGAGRTALRKAQALHQGGARLRVVAPEAVPGMQRLCREEGGEWLRREWQEADLEGCALVVAASDDASLNAQVARAALRRGLLVNVADAPSLGNFVFPSVIDRSPVQVAIATGGTSPVLARLLRSRLEALIPPAYGRLAALVGSFRERVRRQIPDAVSRRRFWEGVLTGPVQEMVFNGREEAALEQLERQLGSSQAEPPPRGEVYLVGAGPGDPDLLTFRALRLMQQAEVVLYDRLVAPVLLDLVRHDAERIYVGKASNRHTLPQEEINRTLVELAREGRRVLRLKGGDPFIFGRGGEEIEDLAAAGIPFQVVPGITAAAGCASYAGIPLTHRDYAQSCLLVTGHLKDGSPDLNWEAMVQPAQTLVIYMGVQGLEPICQGLMARGMDPEMPAALVERGTTPRQRVISATVATLVRESRAAGVKPPGLVIIGEVVRLREKLAWFEPVRESEE